MGVNDVKFLNTAEEKLIVERIGALETRTTAEIRVHLAGEVTKHGVLQDATKTFTDLGMQNTAQRNGVLLYIAIKAHEFAVLGDEGIHRHMGTEGWNAVSAQLTADFKNGDFGIGILKALDTVGAQLARHFPATEGSVNPDELSNEISKN